MAFSGFSEGARAFLAELAENNDRAWFAENRERYERDLLGRRARVRRRDRGGVRCLRSARAR